MPLVEVLGIPEVLRNNRQILDRFGQEVERILQRRAEETATLAREKAPIATGNLRANITVDRPIPFAREVHSGNAEYAVFVEFGSGPHWPPSEPLKRWALRKLGDERLGYAVQRKIAAVGTQEQPFFRPAIEEVRPKYHRDMEDLARRVSGK